MNCLNIFGFTAILLNVHVFWFLFESPITPLYKPIIKDDLLESGTI